MNKKAINTTEAPRPGGPYSQGIMSNGLLFTAGFGPQEPVTGKIAEGIQQQTRQVMLNIQAVLRDAGVGLDDIIKTTVHLQDLRRDFAEFNAVYSAHFSEPYPVRTTVGSNLYDILVEIDVVAVLPVES